MSAVENQTYPNVRYPIMLIDPALCTAFGYGDECKAEQLRAVFEEAKRGLTVHNNLTCGNMSVPKTYPILLEREETSARADVQRAWSSVVKCAPPGTAKLWRLRVDNKGYVDVPLVCVNAPDDEKEPVYRFGQLIEDDALKSMTRYQKAGGAPYDKFMSALGVLKNADEPFPQLDTIKMTDVRRRLSENYVLHVDTSCDEYKDAIRRDFNLAVAKLKHSGTPPPDTYGEECMSDVLSVLDDALSTLVFRFVPVHISGAGSTVKFRLHAEATPLITDNPIACALFVMAFAPARTFGALRTWNPFWQKVFFDVFTRVHLWSDKTIDACMALVMCQRHTRVRGASSLDNTIRNQWMPAPQVRRKKPKDDNDKFTYSLFSMTHMILCFMAEGADVVDMKMEVEAPDAVKYKVRTGKKRVDTKTVKARDILAALRNPWSSPQTILMQFGELVGIPIRAFKKYAACSPPQPVPEKSVSAHPKASDVGDCDKAKDDSAESEHMSAADVLSAPERASGNDQTRKRARNRSGSRASRPSKRQTRCDGSQDEHMEQLLQTLQSRMTDMLGDMLEHKVKEVVERVCGPWVTSAQEQQQRMKDDVDAFLRAGTSKSARRRSPSLRKRSRQVARASDADAAPLVIDSDSEENDDNEDYEMYDDEGEEDVDDGNETPPQEIDYDSEETAVIESEQEYAAEYDEDSDRDTIAVAPSSRRREPMALEDYERIRAKVNDFGDEEDADEFESEYSSSEDDEDDESLESDEEDDESDEDVLDPTKPHEELDRSAEPVDKKMLEHVKYADVKNGTFDPSAEDVVIVRYEHIDLYEQVRKIQAEIDEEDADYKDDDDESDEDDESDWKTAVLRRWKELPKKLRNAVMMYGNTCVMGEAYCVTRNNQRVKSSPALHPMRTIGYDVAKVVNHLPSQYVAGGDGRTALRQIIRSEDRAEFDRGVFSFVDALKDHDNGRLRQCAFGVRSLLVLCDACRRAADMDHDTFVNKYSDVLFDEDKDDGMAEVEKSDRITSLAEWHKHLHSMIQASPKPVSSTAFKMWNAGTQKAVDLWCPLTGRVFYPNDGPRSSSRLKYVRMSPHENAVDPKTFIEVIGERLKCHVYFEVEEAAEGEDLLSYPGTNSIVPFRHNIRKSAKAKRDEYKKERKRKTALSKQGH